MFILAGRGGHLVFVLMGGRGFLVVWLGCLMHTPEPQTLAGTWKAPLSLSTFIPYISTPACVSGKGDQVNCYLLRCYLVTLSRQKYAFNDFCIVATLQTRRFYLNELLQIKGRAQEGCCAVSVFGE